MEFDRRGILSGLGLLATVTANSPTQVDSFHPDDQIPFNYADKKRVLVTVNSCRFNLSMETHINTTCNAALFHLRNFSRIRKYLSIKSTEILVHALITSKIDFCNAVLYGAPENLLQKLQSVQNCAARLVCLKAKYEHITPLLKDLHCLPAKYRIEFKIQLITFKCLNNLAPYYLQELINVYNPSDNLGSLLRTSLSPLPTSYRAMDIRRLVHQTPVTMELTPGEFKELHKHLSR